MNRSVEHLVVVDNEKVVVLVLLGRRLRAGDVYSC